MLLSDILPKLDKNITFNLINEQSFDGLGLIVTKNTFDTCSFIDEEKYINEISDNIKMLIINEQIYSKLSNCEFKFGICVVDNPRLLYFRIHNYLSDKEGYKRTRFKTRIGKNCNISNASSISENNVSIGNNVQIEEFVVIRDNTIIGDDVIIRAGSIIGGEGFEYKRTDSKIESVKHIGGVIIGNEVEIKHNVVIDKAVYPWDNTIIGEYSKIDSLVELAHGSKIGENVMIIAGASVFGRTEIKDRCRIGPGAIVRNGIVVNENSNINLGSVVTKSVERNTSVTGNFAIEHSKYIEIFKQIYSECSKL